MIAIAPLEEVPAEMRIGLHMADGGLDGGPALQLTFDLSVDGALLARQEHAERMGGIVAEIALSA